MSTITEIQASDAPKDSRAVINTNFSTLNTDKVEGQASSVDGEIALFSGTGGKTIKRATGSGIVKATSGVLSVVSPVPVADGGTNAATAAAGLQNLMASWNGWIDFPTTLTYASADAPTFVATTGTNLSTLIQPGMRIKLVQTTAKYFIVTAVSSNSLTLYGGTDYTLVNAAISSIAYSPMKAPYGFPLDPAKWTVTTTYSSDTAQTSVTGGAWYNIGSVNISIPIGAWVVSAKSALSSLTTANFSSVTIQSTLSTANNSETNTAFSSLSGNYDGDTGSVSFTYGGHYVEALLTLASKTTYYYNFTTNRTGSTITVLGASYYPVLIKAVSAYL